MMLTERQAALFELLARPDLPCLPHRGHQMTHTGDPARRSKRLEMLSRFLIYREHTIDGELVDVQPAQKTVWWGKKREWGSHAVRLTERRRA